MPWAYSTKPDENCNIEQQVDAWLQTIILCLDPKPVIPCEDVAGHETSENIISANQAASPNDEELPKRQQGLCSQAWSQR